MENLIDMFQFCCDKAYRYDFTKPFVLDGFVYATDMIICVRLPSDEKNSEGKFPKDMTFAFKPVIGPTTIPWPTEFVNEIAPCPECDGSGKYEEECENCEGSGRDECPECCGDIESGECDGDGYTESGECEACHGEGEFAQDTEQNIGVGLIKAKYGKMILSLPNVKYRPPKINESIYFTFDGGDGVVAQLHQDR